MVGVALSQLKHRLAQHLVEIHLPTDLPPVKADFVLIVRVLTNLLDNAAKYSPLDTTIEVHARVNDMVEIQIMDHGTGVPEADVKRIFEKFYRTETAGGTSGVGLGLSICRGIVEAHGGSIRAQNRPGGGMIITFTLPTAIGLEAEP
jgi:two-component system sensor histidine kinase KdpD